MQIQFNRKAAGAGMCGQQMRMGVVAALALVLMVFGRPGAANAQGLYDTTNPVTAGVGSSDVVAPQDALAAYVQANALGGRVTQVILSTLPKISQYWDINTSASGYGYNACGLVAAAAALGGPDWTPLVGSIAAAAGSDYSARAGIQPSRYVAALQTVFGSQAVAASNGSTLSGLYQALADGKIVIVDMQVNAYTEQPSVRGPNYAHFARVLGIDVNRGEIYIQNTLSGGAYWTLSLTKFVQVWGYPETTATIIPDPAHAEAVTHWMVVLDNAALG